MNADWNCRCLPELPGHTRAAEHASCGTSGTGVGTDRDRTAAARRPKVVKQAPHYSGGGGAVSRGRPVERLLHRSRAVEPGARVELGKRGETRACEALTRRGYAILARRYRTRVGEIDIVCRDGATIVFVEVKTRVSDRLGSPLEAVTERKQRRIVAMARHFIARHRLEDRPCRFDVVGVRCPRGKPATVQIVRDAFWVP